MFVLSGEVSEEAGPSPEDRYCGDSRFDRKIIAVHYVRVDIGSQEPVLSSGFVWIDFNGVRITQACSSIVIYSISNGLCTSVLISCSYRSAVQVVIRFV